MGGPTHTHTPNDNSRATVRAMVAARLPMAAIAGAIGVGPDTVRKYYAEELKGLARGRMTHRPTDGTRFVVRGLSLVGTPLAEIATAIGVSESTIKQYYVQEIAVSKYTLAAMAGMAMYDMLHKSNTDTKSRMTAAIYATKAVGGWSEYGNGAGVKQQRTEAAAVAATGKFAPAPPPGTAVKLRAVK